jgi:hypothetical protein
VDAVFAHNRRTFGARRQIGSGQGHLGLRCKLRNEDFIRPQS